MSDDIRPAPGTAPPTDPEEQALAEDETPLDEVPVPPLTGAHDTKGG